MNVNERIEELFERYASRTITQAELDEFIIRLNGVHTADSQTLSQPLLRLWEQAKAGQLTSASQQPEWENMYRNITAKQPARIFYLKRMAAAAAVLIVIASAAVFFLNKKETPAITQTAHTRQLSPEEVKPGKNHAILTIADGSQIELDSAKTANIENASIANGAVSYSSAQNNAVATHTLSTSRGNKYQLTLPDGSIVWLNAASSITYPTAFTGKERNVSITGEAYFEVAKMTDKPFKVKAYNLEVQVLGTHFNINSYMDEKAIATTLLEGTVRVVKNNEQVLLRPGYQALLVNDKIVSSETNADMAVAWVRGYFQFSKADIQTIMRQVGRWYDLDIEYEGNMPERLFTGKLERDLPLSTITRFFEQAGLKFRIEGKRMVVSM